MEYVKHSIFKTLLYSDIFDFPLRYDELWDFSVSERPISKEEFDMVIDSLARDQSISYIEQYYCLKGHEKIIQKRKDNLSEVSKKLEIARKAARYLSYIPTVQLIGISGGLAIHDVDQEDDIDFFIITKSKTLFVTRVFVLGILQILKLRRTRLDKDPADKICVNYMLDENNLRFAKDKQDIYIAHEIVQLKPLFDRENTYEKFLRVNTWVKKFFVNAKPQKLYFLKANTRSDSLMPFTIILKFTPFINFFKWAQIRYLQRHQTIERVTEGVIAFHPNDYRVQTLHEMNLKLRQLGLLTNS